jgi:hypothetical protein
MNRFLIVLSSVLIAGSQAPIMTLAESSFGPEWYKGIPFSDCFMDFRMQYPGQKIEYHKTCAKVTATEGEAHYGHKTANLYIENTDGSSLSVEISRTPKARQIYDVASGVFYPSNRKNIGFEFFSYRGTTTLTEDGMEITLEGSQRVQMRLLGYFP